MKIWIRLKLNNKKKNIERKGYFDQNCMRFQLIWMSEEDIKKIIQNKKYTEDLNSVKNLDLYK